jgi:hypothetical protein
MTKRNENAALVALGSAFVKRAGRGRGIKGGAYCAVDPNYRKGQFRGS